MTRKGKILNDLHAALDDLCFKNHAPKRRSNKTFSMVVLDNHVRAINKSFFLHFTSLRSYDSHQSLCDTLLTLFHEIIT